MKKVGFIGGLGPPSTVDYYLGYIGRVRKAYGENCFPEFTVENVNLAKVINGISEKRYSDTADYLLESIGNLKAAGAEIAAITANTPHIVWDIMCERFPIPVISIIDASIDEMKERDFRKVVVFGTQLTLESGLYDSKMIKAGIEPVIPTDEDKKKIGDLIFPNLENGVIIPEERDEMLALAEKYITGSDADAILLGCTEIPLVIKNGDVSVPVLDTAQIHLDAIFKAAQ
ncbi:MAG: amino acid racemase [Ruminiclostridium sp.]|nr:amino acid racemase [Ruminiclostridium sp.]